jgi:hypothetical protein
MRWRLDKPQQSPPEVNSPDWWSQLDNGHITDSKECTQLKKNKNVQVCVSTSVGSKLPTPLASKWFCPFTHDFQTVPTPWSDFKCGSKQKQKASPFELWK